MNVPNAVNIRQFEPLYCEISAKSNFSINCTDFFNSFLSKHTFCAFKLNITEAFLLSTQDIIVEDIRLKIVKNKHLGMPPFLAEGSLVLSFST